MMYEIEPGDSRNLDRILRVAKLKDHFRFDFKKMKARPAQYAFGFIPVRKARPEGYYARDGLSEIWRPVTRDEAIYDGKFIRIWSNPQTVEYWNYGHDIEFKSEEEANKFYDACMASTGCKYTPSS